MSIRSRLILSIASVLLAFVAGVGYFSYVQIGSRLAEHSYADATSSVDATLQFVNLYFDRVGIGLAGLANDPSILAALESPDADSLARSSEALTEVKATVGVVDHLSLLEISESGCLIRSTDALASSLVAGDRSDRDYCKGILGGETYHVSTAFVSSFSNRPVIAVSVPVRNAEGKTSGLLMGAIDLESLRGYLWDLQSDSKVDLLDRDGTLFLTTDREIASLDDPGGDETELARVRRGMAGSVWKDGFRDGLDFVEYRFDGDIAVVHERSATKLFSLGTDLGVTIGLALLATLLTTMAVVTLLIGGITRKISRVSAAAQAISSGNFSAKIDQADLRGKDETAMLARAFDAMARRLTDIYASLEQKVAERSLLVEKKNAELRETQEQTKRALETAEQANHLMVGRELGMIKLKEEIHRLKESQKKSV